MLCFFFPVLFALTLEQVLRRWEHTADRTLGQAAQGGWGVSILGDPQTLTRRGPEQPALAAPALSRAGVRPSPEVPSSLNHPKVLWQGKGSKSNQSPERQRGTELSGCRYSGCPFTYSFHYCRRTSLTLLSVSILSVTHACAITNISGLQSEENLGNNWH